MLEWIKALLLFFYGTTPKAVSHHTQQARIVAMTLGGVIAFVSVPFFAAGTTFLVLGEIPESAFPGLRWLVLAAAACVLTVAMVWVERAMVILGDAVGSNWILQGMLLVVRVAIIYLFSAVIAKEWEMAQHSGLIRSELQTMADEALERNEKFASREHDVEGVKTRTEAARTRLEEVRASLAMLPPELVAAKTQVQQCELDRARLTAQWQALDGIQSPTAEQIEQKIVIGTSARVKGAECRQLAANTRQRIHDYETPLKADQVRLAKALPLLNNDYVQALDHARQTFQERNHVARQALSESGSAAKAFIRVRQSNPEIDHAVKVKTMTFAAIELLPLLLKLLLRNSPIASEARALLQEESAKYRIRETQSRLDERAARYLPPWLAPGALPGPAVVVNPLRRASPVRPVPSVPASELTTDGYWIGYPNL